MTARQNFRGKFGHRQEGIALPEQKMPAGPRGRTIGHVPGEHHARPPPGKTGRQDGGPKIAAVVAVNDLDLLPSNPMGQGADIAPFGHAEGWHGEQRHPGGVDGGFKGTPGGRCQPDPLAGPLQAGGKLHTLVIRPPATQQGVHLENAPSGVTHAFKGRANGWAAGTADGCGIAAFCNSQSLEYFKKV